MPEPGICFERALATWPGADFGATLRAEILALDPDCLPLQEALELSSHVAPGPLGVTMLSVSHDEDFIKAKVGISYSGIIAGCSCADDPTPLSEIAEYCEVLFHIDRRTARTTLFLVE